MLYKCGKLVDHNQTMLKFLGVFFLQKKTKKTPPALCHNQLIIQNKPFFDPLSEYWSNAASKCLYWSLLTSQCQRVRGGLHSSPAHCRANIHRDTTIYTDIHTWSHQFTCLTFGVWQICGENPPGQLQNIQIAGPRGTRTLNLLTVKYPPCSCLGLWLC